ncbi:MAG: serine/threonine-protein kinase, partial [Candidatus Solibacter sp.]
MEFELGQTYSGYKILDVVRRSRSAVQYRVQNTLAQRVESLSTLTGAAVEDPDAAERFLREVRIRARLSHPHILTFYTAVPIEGRMAMTTELPDSQSLADRLLVGPLPWREALEITRQLLDAFECLHRQSFVHLDVTPENILFGEGFCKLADFSHARPIDPVQQAESGNVTGNPRYISPEQVKGEGNLDARSDLYSLGVVLYEMLCGCPPFGSRSQFELMMAHVHKMPAAPSSVNPRVPTELDALVLRALAKERAERFQSAGDFCDAIAAYVRGAVAEGAVEVIAELALGEAAVEVAAAATAGAAVEASADIAAVQLAAPTVLEAVADVEAEAAAVATPEPAEAAVEAASEGIVPEAKITAPVVLEPVADVEAETATVATPEPAEAAVEVAADVIAGPEADIAAAGLLAAVADVEAETATVALPDPAQNVAEASTEAEDLAPVLLEVAADVIAGPEADIAGAGLLAAVADVEAETATVA